jgi:hypothetical protein
MSGIKETFIKKGPPDILGKVVIEDRKLGNRRYITLEHGETSVLKPIGGVRFLPEAGSDKVELLTWNVGISEYRKRSNRSHAERTFYNWFKQKLEEPEWKERVKKIEIINEPFSPCDDCCYDLTEILDELKEGKQISRLEKAKISWKVPFGKAETPEALNIAPPFEKTTKKGLKKLTEAGWELTGPLPTGVTKEMLIAEPIKVIRRPGKGRK